MPSIYDILTVRITFKKYVKMWKLCEDRLIQRLLHPNGHFLDSAGSLTLDFVQVVLDGT